MRRLCITVLLVHAAVVCALMQIKPLEKKADRQHLAVRTVRIQPVKAVAAASQKKAVAAPLKPKQALPVKKTVPPAVQKQVVSTPPRAPRVPKQLLQELEESIAKIDQKRDKLYTGKEIPQPTRALHIDETEADFVRMLTEHLEQSLHLPDFGEVKIALTLQENGTVIKVVVLKVESEKNRRYLEAHLPLLKFPHLKQKQNTFILTFCNEVPS